MRYLNDAKKEQRILLEEFKQGGTLFTAFDRIKKEMQPARPADKRRLEALWDKWEMWGEPNDD